MRKNTKNKIILKVPIPRVTIVTYTHVPHSKPDDLQRLSTTFNSLAPKRLIAN